MINSKYFHFNMGQHTCITCSQTFARKDHLKRHIDNIHKKITSVKCETCGKTFSRKDNLKQHFDLVHKYSYSHNDSQKDDTLPYKRKKESDHMTVETNEVFRRARNREIMGATMLIIPLTKQIPRKIHVTVPPKTLIFL